MELSEKLRDNFDEMVVYKDLKKTNFFSTLSLPAFMRDWLLKKFEDDEGEFDKDDLARFVKSSFRAKTTGMLLKTILLLKVGMSNFLLRYLSILILEPAKYPFPSRISHSVLRKRSSKAMFGIHARKIL